ncbi:MAG TPA: lamin tail domain-containing protein, partial [Candidatus Paceibacterota bacterium]|nr:lamin tail domain-containing protein [Candidatus Paceibacterota bacterium]
MMRCRSNAGWIRILLGVFIIAAVCLSALEMRADQEFALDETILGSDAAELTGEGAGFTASLEPAVLISEFMADNKRTQNDEDGESSDWIEIFNSSDVPVNLGGWHLTDDVLNPAQWPFPDLVLPEHGRLLVFASGKNKTNATERLHTNFRLSASGGYLALITPALEVSSDFSP